MPDDNNTATTSFGDARDQYPNSPGMVSGDPAPAPPAGKTASEGPDGKAPDAGNNGVDKGDGAAADGDAVADAYVNLFPAEHREAFAGITDAIREAGIPGLQAEGLSKAILERDQAMNAAVHQVITANWTKQADGWRASAQEKFSREDLGDARRIALKLFDANTIRYLDEMRFTDHPAFILAMVNVSKATAEDTFVSGRAGGGSQAGDARVLYPNSNMNP